MENSKIKLGIIGMGRMGITHYSIINPNPNVKIVSVADTSKMVISLMAKYINDLEVYKDYNELLEKSDIDAVLVCTPPNLHFPIIVKANKKNVHVFVEKPFTTKYDEAKQLADLYNANGLINQVGYVNRNNDCFIKSKQLIEDGVLGKIIRFKSEMFSRTITKSDEGSGWRAASENGGGVIFEMASHAIDLVNYLVGIPDKIIGTSVNQIFSKHVEDAVSSTFLYKDGKSGTIYVNWSDESYRKPTNKLEVFGTEGKLQVDQHSIKIYLKKENKKENLRVGWNTLYITDIFKNVPFYVRGNEFTKQLFSFVDCIKENSNNENLCTFNDGVAVLDVIEKMFKDYKNNGRM